MTEKKQLRKGVNKSILSTGLPCHSKRYCCGKEVLIYEKFKKETKVTG